LPIDLDDTTPGTYALVQVVPQDGEERFELRADYPRTNQSHESRERGWCGSTNNVSVHACGCVEAYIDKRGRTMLRAAPDDALWESAEG